MSNPGLEVGKGVEMKRWLIFPVLICVGLCLILRSYPIFAKEEANMAKVREERIDLPQPRLKGKMSLEEAIKLRRSKRSYSPKELSLEQIGQLVWSAQGITDKVRGFRAAPSAGALYPLEIYVVRSDGLFHYGPGDHSLVRLSHEDLRQKLARAALWQGFIGQAPVNIVITGVYERVTSKYGERGLRYVDIEVGHAAQNIHLQAVALGLGSVPVGAFNDKAVKDVLSLPGDHKPLYIIPIGYAD